MAGNSAEKPVSPFIIVGAGMAGLSAALKLKEKNLPFIILEAGTGIGGRAHTVDTATGIPVDMGAHWVHNMADGSQPLLQRVLNDLDISYRKDPCTNINSYTPDGQAYGKAFRNYEGVDWDLAEHIARGDKNAKGVIEEDRSIYDIISPSAKPIIDRVLTTWLGAEPGTPVSVKEFTDSCAPGGLIVEGGMQHILEKLADKIGREHIRLQTPVSHIAETAKGIQVTIASGEKIEGTRAIYTGSVGALKSEMVTFDPPPGQAFSQNLSKLQMGHMTKIALELDADFFAGKKNLENLHIDQPGPPSRYLNINPPLAMLYMGGKEAEKIELLNPVEARHYFDESVKHVKELEGYASHVRGNPLISQWAHNPYMQGAYSNALPGADRGMQMRVGDHIALAGEAFDTEFSGSLTGAYRSGQAVAEYMAAELQKERAQLAEIKQAAATINRSMKIAENAISPENIREQQSKQRQR